MLAIATFEERGHDRFEGPVESHGHDRVDLTPEPHPLERLEHVVLHGTDTDAIGLVAQATTPAHRPLLAPARHTRVRVEHVAVRVLPDAERHLHAPIARRGHRTDLLRPRTVGLRDTRVRLDDLMTERLVGRDEGPIFGWHRGAPFERAIL